jgi:hypothetical protein
MTTTIEVPDSRKVLVPVVERCNILRTLRTPDICCAGRVWKGHSLGTLPAPRSHANPYPAPATTHTCCIQRFEPIFPHILGLPRIVASPGPAWGLVGGGGRQQNGDHWGTEWISMGLSMDAALVAAAHRVVRLNHKQNEQGSADWLFNLAFVVLISLVRPRRRVEKRNGWLD